MHIGLYFGSFNPIHNGHTAIALYMLEHYDFEQIWIIVTPNSPFKSKEELIDENIRLQMVKLATEENMAIFISSHNLAELESFCNKVCIIKDGVIVETSTLNTIKRKSNEICYLIDVDSTKEVNLLFKNEIINDKTVKVWCNKEFIPVVIESLVKSNVKIYSVKEEQLSLEDAFLERTGGNQID